MQVVSRGRCLRGVTLTELLITIIIIAILSVVVATNLSTGTDAAKKAQLQAMAGEVTSALKSAYANKPTANNGVPEIGLPGWNGGNAPDPTYWEYYMEEGAVARVLAQRDKFGFLAPSGGDWSNVRAHPTAGGPSSFTIPLGTDVPLRLYLQDDATFTGWKTSPPAGMRAYDGVPYHPYP